EQIAQGSLTTEYACREAQPMDRIVCDPEEDRNSRETRGSRICLLTTPDHGTGIRYRLRCTLSRVKAYVSAVRPGATSVDAITRTPGRFTISCSVGSPSIQLSGRGRPGVNGKT